jgi:pimeloyl-ACP methyl ester carboxylesterase
MKMAFANANGISLCYEVFKAAEKRSAEPLIFIRGLGTQMIQWPQPFIDYFTQAGFDVIIFDNRDVGESSKLDAAWSARYYGAAGRCRSRCQFSRAL